MDTHPVRLNVTDDLQRSRLTVFFRLLLAIPHFIVLMLWGIVVYFAAILNWIATLIAGTPPAGLWGFIVKFLRYSTQVSAYANLVANPYPAFGGGDYPVDVTFDGPARQNRWITGFRCLFTARMPEGMRNLLAYCIRYQVQTYAYMLIVTDRYPSFSSGQPDVIEAPAVPAA
jgi:hypothetical protein